MHMYMYAKVYNCVYVHAQVTDLKQQPADSKSQT